MPCNQKRNSVRQMGNDLRVGSWTFPKFDTTHMFGTCLQTKKASWGYSKTHFANHDHRYVFHNNLHHSGRPIKDLTDELRFSGIPVFFFVKVVYRYNNQTMYKLHISVSLFFSVVVHVHRCTKR